MLRPLLRLALALALAPGAAAQAPGSTSVIAGGERGFRGAPISLSVKNADLQDVLRLISRTAKLNLVMDDDLRGKTVTLELEEVPWDQALDLVLRAQGLGAEWNGNVLQIASTAELTRDLQERGRLRELQQDSGRLVSVARTLSHANAVDAEAIVRAHLSDRGRLTIDRRTNTLVIQDTPAVIAKITGMLEYSTASRAPARGPKAPQPAAPGPILHDWNAWLLESGDSFVGRLAVPGSQVRGIAGSPSTLARAQLSAEDLELAKLLLGRLTEQGRLEVLEALPFGLGPSGGTSIELGPLGSLDVAGNPPPLLRLDLGLERDGGRFALTFRCFRSTGARLPLAWHGRPGAGWVVELQPEPGEPWRVLLIAPAS